MSSSKLLHQVNQLEQVLEAKSSRAKQDLDRYRLGTLDKGLTILEWIERAAKPLSIQDVARATGIQRAAVFRLLCTLEQRGYVQRLDNKKYAIAMRRRRYLIGYCAPLAGTSFRTLLATNIQRAAQECHVDLLEVDNREDDLEAGLRNAQILVDAKVDLAILFEPVESIGLAIADRLYCFAAFIHVLGVSLVFDGPQQLGITLQCVQYGL